MSFVAGFQKWRVKAGANVAAEWAGAWPSRLGDVGMPCCRAICKNPGLSHLSLW